jgi:hypothetical protein
MFLAALDVTTSFLTSAATQHYFVDNYGNPAEIVSMPPAFTAESTLTVFIAFLAQQFFAYQLFNLNKRSWVMTTLVSIICITSLGAFGKLSRLVLLSRILVEVYESCRPRLHRLGLHREE